MKEKVKELIGSIGLDAVKIMIQEIEKENKVTPEQRFLELIKDCVIKYDFEKYPNTLFWFEGDNVLMEYNTKSEYLWVRYSSIWSVFESEFSLNYDQIKCLIKGMVEEHFNLKEVTPIIQFIVPEFQVEEHFNLKEVTPSERAYCNCVMVEEHFNLKEVTPVTANIKNKIMVEEHFNLKEVTPRTLY